MKYSNPFQPFAVAYTSNLRYCLQENIKYRFSFNGKENDNEVKGGGGQQDYGMRVYDTRLSRFLSIDPLTKDFPELTPYQFASNDPIESIDLDGEERFDYRRTTDDKGVSKITLTGKSDIITKTYSIEYTGWLPKVVYTTHVNEVQEHVVTQSGEYYLDGVYGLQKFTDDESITFITKEAVLNATDLDFANTRTDIRFRIQQGLAFVSEEVKENGGPNARQDHDPAIAVPYKRPNNATTKNQRASVQNKPCVDCGATGQKNVADHKTPLVEEYYRTGTINKKKMHASESVQPQCTTCSSKQGKQMSEYSKQKKQRHGLN